MAFEGSNHLTSAKQIANPEILNKIFRTDDILRLRDPRSIAVRQIQERYEDDVCGALIFVEESSRTRWSAFRAGRSLSIDMLNDANAKIVSSLAKGESITDAMLTLNAIGYNLIVYRSDKEGSADEAAAVSEAPVINAGDGAGEHPTQALADARTIHDEYGGFSGLTIAHVGDPGYSRSVHSQVELFKPYGVKHIFSSIPELAITPEYREQLIQDGVEFEEVPDFREAADMADVIDMSRFQKARQSKKPGESDEHFEERLNSTYFKYLGATALRDEVLKIAEQKKSIILHPWPRNLEIPVEYTKHPRGRWEQQMTNKVRQMRAIFYLALTDQLYKPQADFRLPNVEAA